MTSTDAEQSTKSVPIYNAKSSYEHSHSCNDASHHHYPSFYDFKNDALAAAAAKTEISMKRKAKNSQKQDVTRAELIPGHRGNSTVDDLVKFINGPSPSTTKKSKKKSPTSS
ncbi:unnamed protein product [Adineta ricciae]|uniref:Uncharacterized protein n=1 Tax=Adineta ricciae TaxID=249248 RepID=A0A814R5I8_ADIRI|nr:unnamed protein product [Adineta ricciae]CAF1128975.1 unnamed protein product [Adineta ricciae]